jgi:DNA-directed RNA polymerase specialized sigma24 family protein
MQMRPSKSLVNLSNLCIIIRNIILNHDAVNDDILQNTFIKIFQNLKKFKENKLFSWMYRIATNETLNFKQKRKKQKSHLKRYKIK